MQPANRTKSTELDEEWPEVQVNSIVHHFTLYKEL